MRHAHTHIYIYIYTWIMLIMIIVCVYIYRRAGWGFSLICGLSQDKCPSKMGTYHWEVHQVFLMHICRVQSQVPFSGTWKKMGQAHTIEKLWGFAYKPLNIYVCAIYNNINNNNKNNNKNHNNNNNYDNSSNSMYIYIYIHNLDLAIFS